MNQEPPPPPRRLRDQQIQELRSELATKDLRLSAARAELLESHMQLQVLDALPFTLEPLCPTTHP